MDRCIMSHQPGPYGTIDMECDCCPYDHSNGLLCGANCPRCDKGLLTAADYSRKPQHLVYDCLECGHVVLPT